MKAVRILQVLLVIVLGGYFLLVDAANPTLLSLPFFLPLPPALVVALALVLGWLIGWTPGRIATWRKSRELHRMQRRVAELERHVPSYDKGAIENTPVIPDRIAVARDEDEDRGGG